MLSNTKYVFQQQHIFNLKKRRVFQIEKYFLS